MFFHENELSEGNAPFSSFHDDNNIKTLKHYQKSYGFW